MGIFGLVRRAFGNDEVEDRFGLPDNLDLLTFCVREKTVRKVRRWMRTGGKHIPCVAGFKPMDLDDELVKIGESILQSGQPKMAVVEATQTQRRNTIEHCVTWLRRLLTIDVRLSILVEEGKSHSLIQRGGTVKTNYGGFERLLETLERKGLHFLDTKGLSIQSIERQCAQHHFEQPEA